MLLTTAVRPLEIGQSDSSSMPSRRVATAGKSASMFIGWSYRGADGSCCEPISARELEGLVAAGRLTNASVIWYTYARGPETNHVSITVADALQSIADLEHLA